MHPVRQIRPPRSRVNVSLLVGGQTWQVYFLDVSRVGADWLVECAVVGARLSTVTVHCRAEATHSDTARRVIEAVRQWLQTGDAREDAYLEIPQVLGLAS
jgi:hypothetical protein